MNPSKEQLFWDWFKLNEARYFFLNQINDEKEKETALDDFLAHLHSYCDHLFFEIGGYPNEKQDLIITAEGNEDFFGQVIALVNQAPQLDYWNIIAFKPAKGDYEIGYKGITLNPKAMWFMPLNSKLSPKLGLRIYTDDYDPEADQEDFLTATFLVLDNLLGEKACASEIGHIELESLSLTSTGDLIELNKLAKYLDWRASKAN